MIANQRIRSGTSVGANDRSACRGRSKADFAAMLGVVVQEADESAYWLELIMEGGLMSAKRVEPHEITAIMVASRKTASKLVAATRKSEPNP